MRQRSKSISVPAASYEQSESESDSDIGMEDSKVKDKKSHINESTNKLSWPVEDRILLLCKLKGLIPWNDNIPFDERLKAINWNHATFKNYTAQDVKEEFNQILKKARTFRLLEEIIEEKHKEMIPKLGVEKPVPAFALFIRENKDQIEQASKSFSKKGSFTQVAGDMFNKCNEKVRDEYKHQANKMKEEYRRTMAAYELPKQSPSSKNNSQSKTNNQNKDVPVKLFIQTKLLENPKASKLALRQEYIALPKNKKLKWILRWLGLEKGAKANLKQYLKCKEMLTKQEMELFNEYEGRPRSITAYHLFMRSKLSNKISPDIKNREAFKACADEWKTLPEDEKAKYLSEAKQIRKNYTVDITRFVSSLPTDRHEFEIKALSSKEAGSGKIQRSKLDAGINDHKSSNNTSRFDVYSDDSNDDFSEQDEDETVFQCNTSVLLDQGNDKVSSDDNSEDEDALQHKSSDEIPQKKTKNDTPNLESPTKRRSEKEAPIKKSVYDSSDDDDGDALDISRGQGKSKNVLLSPQKSSEPAGYDSKKNKRKHKDLIGQSPLANSTIKKEETVAKKVKRMKEESISQGSDYSFDLESSQSRNNCGGDRSDKLKKKYKKLLAIKPPETLMEYYAAQHFGGSIKKAKKAWNLLDEEAKSECSDQFEAAKQKYIKKFKLFANALTAMELSQFSEELGANQ